MEYENKAGIRTTDHIDLNIFPDIAVLTALLQDRTTKRNIIFVSDAYCIDGEPVDTKPEITSEVLRKLGDSPIRPRCFKSRPEQADRTRKYSEVFTPVWICNKMNYYCDEEWFGRKDVFNTENGQDHTVTEEKIIFPKGKRWQKYVDSRRLEITCGEAPFPVSRYDTADGSPILIKERVGIPDRKMRIVNENKETESDRLEWTYRAFQSVLWI